jgi:stage II sporulation protein D
MGKKMWLVLALVVVIISVAVAETDKATLVPTIQVGIAVNQEVLQLSAEGDFRLLGGGDQRVIGQYKARERVLVAVTADQITVNGQPTANQEIHLEVMDAIHPTAIVNDHHFRGYITIHRTTGKPGLTAVNSLSVDEYLYGVLPREVSPTWPLEALKAQAVASRTFVLYHCRNVGDDGYAVNGTTDFQVYNGKDVEDYRTIRAVNDTTGLVIMYQGKLIDAFFHSNGGGYTENSENVWGTYYPYLRGVPDFDENSGHYKWVKEMPTKDLEAALAAAGYHLGALQAVVLTPLAKQPMTLADRGVSGRVKTMWLIGSTDAVQVTGTKIRQLLGLNSTLFEMTVLPAVPEASEHKIVLPTGVKGSILSDKTNIRYLSGNLGEVIQINGWGWGHGIGLSQWGAKAMAENGPINDGTYFKEILKHYYTGVDIQKVY